jgi:hypothetical protein
VATLARRPISVDEIYLHGSYTLRWCEDVVQVGDYAGIATAGPNLAVAFVLPASDDPQSQATVYAALLSTNQGIAYRELQTSRSPGLWLTPA